MKKALTTALMLFVVFCAHDAAAQVGQPWTDRGYVNLNAGFEATSGDLNDATTFPLYDEDASLSVAQAIDSGALVDLSAGARVWRNVSFGIGFHTGSTHSEASVQGSIPHPVFFNRPRPIALSVGDLKRSERAIHVQFGYMVPLSDRLNVHIMLGPSFFKVKQNVVSAIAVAEQGGAFTAVTVTPTITERSDSPVGFNVGVDLGFQLYETQGVKLGAGILIRYAGASSDIQVLSNTVDSDLGGLQVGFGGRLRF